MFHCSMVLFPKDPFAIHFERDLSDTDAETLSPDCAWEKRELKVGVCECGKDPDVTKCT